MNFILSINKGNWTLCCFHDAATKFGCSSEFAPKGPCRQKAGGRRARGRLATYNHGSSLSSEPGGTQC